jgi:hypothetical protein
LKEPLKIAKRLPQQVASLPNLTKPFYEKITLLLHITKIRILLVNSIQSKLKNVKLLAYDYCAATFKFSKAVLTNYYCFSGTNNPSEHTNRHLEFGLTIDSAVCMV